MLVALRAAARKQVTAAARSPARLGEEREARGLGVVGQERVHDAREPDRLAGEV